jgi:hypothetical protein
MLSIDEISLILSHRKLGVTTEDEVIDFVAVWLGSIISTPKVSPIELFRRHKNDINIGVKIEPNIYDLMKIFNVEKVNEE